MSLSKFSSLLVGLCLLTGPLSANYYIESASTPLEDPDDLALESIAIVGEQILEGGLVLIEVTANVRNLGEAAFEKVSFTVATGLEATEGIVEGVARVSSKMADTLAAHALSGASNTFRIVVDAANLDAARDAVQTGVIFVTYATDGLGQVLQNSVGILIEEIVIQSETVLSDGRVLVEFSAKVRNDTDEPYTDVELLLGDLESLGIDGLLNERAQYPEVLDPLELGTGVETLHVITDPAYAEDLKTEILAGTSLSVGTSELWIFSQPPAGIDEPTETAWEGTAVGPGNATDLVFTEETGFLSTLAAGDLLIEVPALHRLAMPEYLNPFDPPDEPPAPVLSEYLPFEVEAVLMVGDKLHVRGRQRQMLDVVVSGTFRQDYQDAYDGAVRDPYKPELGNTYTEEEEEEREELAQIIRNENPWDGRLAELDGMQMIPWHFNDFEISPKIRMSGEVLLKSSGLQLEVKIRDAALETISASLELGGEFNILLETDDEADNTGANESERTKQLFFIPLPPVSFNIGGVPANIQPVVTLDAGVEAVTPSRLYLPLQSAFSVGMEMGWNSTDGTYYMPVDEVVPLRISDPAVFEDTAATAGAWVELGVMLEGSVAEVVNGGPRLALRTSTGFELTPLLDPWWSWDLSVDLLGQFNISFLGLDVFEAEATLFTIAEEHLDAGGPLIPLRGAMDTEPLSTSGLKPLAGRETRWARAFQNASTSGAYDPEATFLVHDPAGFLYAGGSSKVGNAIAKYNDEGDLLWAGQLSFGPRPYDAVLEQDGSLTVVGTWASSIWLARFDSDGTLLWSRRYEGFSTPRGFALMEEEGIIYYYLTGYVFDTVSRDYDPVLIKFASSGDVVWAQRYRNTDEDDQAHGLAVLANGDLILSGNTTQDVEPPDYGTPASSNTLLNAVKEGMLMRVSPEGALVWANTYVGVHTIEFSQVAEGDDETLYVGGHHHRPINEDQPNLLFGRFASDGTLLDHVLIGDDSEWVDELPNGGNTPYDLVEDLQWIDGVLWACGSTGLGADAAAWVMKLTPELGVLFYSVFDGSHGDAFTALGDTGKGIALWGPSDSFLPWNEGGEGSMLLQVLPYEGMLRFNESTGARSLYLQPWIYKSSQTEAFQVYSETNTSPPQRFSNDTSPVPFVAETLVLSEIDDPVDTWSLLDAPISAVVQASSPALIGDFASWSAYYGTAYNEDTPEESSYWAAFLGIDPWTSGFSDVSGLGAEVNFIGEDAFLRISIERLTLVDDLELEWEFSDTLEADSWIPIVPDSFTVIPTGAGKALLQGDYNLDGEFNGFIRPIIRPSFGEGIQAR